MSYWVAVIARNAAQHLPRTLDSLLNQTLKPKRILVVDDGSTDSTPDILKTFARKSNGVVQTVTLPDRGYDIRRVPSNLNLAWKITIASGFKCEFFMISGDDCFYPSEYANAIISRMKSKPEIAVASGRPYTNAGLSREHTPSGSGRMVRSQFWYAVGEEYPSKAGWEAWLLYLASERGLTTKLFHDIVFEHLRPRGTLHQFVYWGAAMYTLGYHPLYAFGRVTINIVRPTLAPGRAMNMLRGYLQARLGSEDPFLSPFESSLRFYVNRQQTHRMIELISSRLLP